MATPNYTVLNTRQIGKTTIMFVLYETGNYGIIEKNEKGAVFFAGDKNWSFQKTNYDAKV